MIAALRPRGTAWLMVMACALTARLAAQDRTDVTWTLEGSQGGYCIWYLADSATARTLVSSQTAITPAGTGAGLPPLLARVVQDEPRFAGWIPGALCVHFYDRISADGKTIAEGKPGRPIVIATSSLAVENAEGATGATQLLLSFMTDNRTVSRTAQDVGFDMDGITVTSRNRVEGGDPYISIDAAGVVIGWTGHPSGDPSVGKTQAMSFGYAGARATRWLIRRDWTPATSRLMVGSLEVDGKNALAKALKASPVRAVGPQEAGGASTLTFHEETHR